MRPIIPTLLLTAALALACGSEPAPAPAPDAPAAVEAPAEEPAEAEPAAAEGSDAAADAANDDGADADAVCYKYDNDGMETHWTFDSTCDGYNCTKITGAQCAEVCGTWMGGDAKLMPAAETDDYDDAVAVDASKCKAAAPTKKAGAGVSKYPDGRPGGMSRPTGGGMSRPGSGTTKKSSGGGMSRPK